VKSPARLVALAVAEGWHFDDLRRASGRIGATLETLEFSKLIGRVGGPDPPVDSIAEADGVLVRLMPPGSLEQVVFRMDVLHRVERLGVPVLNPPRAVEIAVDKYRTLALLDESGAAVPPTVVCESAESAQAAFETLGGDVVVKPLFGAEGRGLMRVSDPELARRAFGTLERLGAVIYVQRPVRHSGSDLRAFVLGGAVLASMRRFAPAGDWRTNVARGGRAEACRLEPALEKLAVRSAQAVGAEMAGVDIVEDLDRGAPVVLEVNAAPGWKALAGASGVDVAAELLSYLVAKRQAS
jgi:ribosomal protein S6--L-glutamate ligase